MRCKGFTLIELLIVVAIIAILAAIAVPNFLEAQTRSKVSRAKSDMRTLATALESYAVDANKPMTCVIPTPSGTRVFSGPSAIFPGSTAGAVSPRFIRLTTPVSYMTSILVDPFVLSPELRGGSTYDTYDYISAFDFNDQYDPTYKRGAGITSGGGWRLASAGPDRKQYYGGGYVNQSADSKWGVDYDATNGSVSDGDIVRVGGGPGPIYDKLPAIDRIQNKYNQTF